MIETERLKIYPLTAPQLALWVEDIAALEKELGCRYMAEPLEGIFLDIIKGQIKVTQDDAENYMWHSFWFLERKSDGVIVGSADFKNLPNEAGEVEIGYGLGSEFEHNVYMTETVQAMCDWALRQKNVSRVIAETERDGYASQRILQRCGFVQTKNGETLWWGK